jgi:hypothetical protein
MSDEFGQDFEGDGRGLNQMVSRFLHGEAKENP